VDDTRPYLQGSHPGFVLRWVSGLLFLVGRLLMLVHSWRTLRQFHPSAEVAQHAS